LRDGKTLVVDELDGSLHLIYTTKGYSKSAKKSQADNVIDALVKKLPSYNKGRGVWFNDLIDKINTAIRNAKQLQEHNRQTHSANPDTNMHELIEILMNLKNKSV
jgi:hypothetical protein